MYTQICFSSWFLHHFGNKNISVRQSKCMQTGLPFLVFSFFGNRNISVRESKCICKQVHHFWFLHYFVEHKHFTAYSQVPNTGEFNVEKSTTHPQIKKKQLKSKNQLFLLPLFKYRPLIPLYGALDFKRLCA